MSLQVDISQKEPSGFRKLIKNTIWGTERGTRYIQTNFEDRIEQLIEPWYVSVLRNDNLLGVINLSERKFPQESHNVSSFYIRYFSFLQSYQSAPKARRRTKTGGALRSSINKIFERGSLDGTDSKSFFYAYVELENEKSWEMCKSFGFTPLRKFSTTVFSRVSPRSSPKVRRLTSEEFPMIQDKLDEFYQGYSMHFTKRLGRDEYFVLEEDGKIIAGVQILPVRWIIKELPGVSGKLIVKFVHRIPYLNRIFNPGNYNFLGCDQIFWVKGHEHRLAELLESVCAIKGYYSALIWSDIESELYKVLRRTKLGPMNKLKSDVPGDIIVNFAQMDEADKQWLSNRPAYIDAFDLT